MTRDRWRSLSEQFEAALGLPAQARAALIERITADDADLGAELTSLLRAHDAASGFMESAPVPGAESDTAPARLQEGARLGAWRIVRLIGYGGMGEVYEAERADAQFEQRAALKLTRQVSARQIERFNVERQILARLEHPGIARLLDGGIAADGTPYAVMEYVEGNPITAWCDSRKADLATRLQLFLQVSEAVAYAHRNLVVHRDIKPGNVLVDAERRVRLLDFGIAKPLDAGTATGATDPMTTALLTPDYAAPEQLAGDPVTTATDVYALGVLLFELLTRERPWAIQGQPLARALQALLERPAPLMSEVARRAADAPLPARSLHGDLDAIVAKCLRQDAQHRYPTVEALMDDVHRHLDGRPVLARSGSTAYRMRQFVRRNRLTVFAASAVLLAIIAGGAAALWQARLAGQEAYRAEAVQDFLISIFQANTQDQADPVKARNTTARELLAAGAARLDQDSSLPPAARDRLLDVIAELYAEMDLRDTSIALTEKRLPWLREHGTAMQLADALVELAADLQETDRRAEALPVLREAERLITRQRPLDHRMAGYVFSYLSQQLSVTDPRASREYAQRAVTHLRRGDPKSEMMLGALFMLTQAQRPTDPQAAAESAREALEVVRKLHGEDHALYGDAALYLADIEATLFMNEAADRHFIAADRIALRATDPHYYLRLQVDLRYGLFLVDTGRLREGWERLTRVLGTAKATKGESYIAWAHEYLGRAAYQRGFLAEARAQAQETLTLRRLREPSDLHAKAAELVFDVELGAGDLEAAEAAITEARRMREAVGTLKEPGFREGILVREGELALARGEVTRAAAQFTAVLNAVVPPLQQFQRYRLAAWIGRSRAHLAQADSEAAQRDVETALAEIGKLGKPLQLRLLEGEAWEQLAAVRARRGDCPSAREALARSRAALEAVSEPQSFRHARLEESRTRLSQPRCQLTA